jgi:hypothetical protein
MAKLSLPRWGRSLDTKVVTATPSAISIFVDDVDMEVADGKAAVPEWTPSFHEKMIMYMLSILSLMVALDACVIVTSLAVSRQHHRRSPLFGTFHVEANLDDLYL